MLTVRRGKERPVGADMVLISLVEIRSWNQSMRLSLFSVRLLEHA